MIRLKTNQKSFTFYGKTLFQSHHDSIKNPSILASKKAICKAFFTVDL